MRPAEIAILGALALACARPSPAKSPGVDARAALAPAVDASPASGDPALVRVAAFDCAKHDVFPGESPSQGPIPAAAGIRAWRGGGPHGANWNVEDLRCAVRASTACTQGRVNLTLRVGQQIVAEQEASVSQGSATFEVVLPAVVWERGYDVPSNVAMLKLPFKTVAFRAQVALDCKAPVTVRPSDSPFTSVIAEDMFVGGFASGE